MNSQWWSLFDPNQTARDILLTHFKLLRSLMNTLLGSNPLSDGESKHRENIFIYIYINMFKFWVTVSTEVTLWSSHHVSCLRHNIPYHKNNQDHSKWFHIIPYAERKNYKCIYEHEWMVEKINKNREYIQAVR